MKCKCGTELTLKNYSSKNQCTKCRNSYLRQYRERHRVVRVDINICGRTVKTNPLDYKIWYKRKYEIIRECVA
jgi:hypothetical protein